ncbi:MAG TPA: ABC transporter substrate-binding protein [Desulfocapsa sulfexigens]|nr:ABC transporter substrate-binding protein [Desulfocapsa sulfexigens]
MKFSAKLYCCFLLGIPLLLCCCDVDRHPLQDSVQKKEILIYCGATMRQPIMELAAIMEKEHDCVVKISYGGSSYLEKSVEVNRIGELFFPGSVSYIHTLQKKGLVSQTVDVGYNEIALYVHKGNPKKVNGDLMELLRPDLRIAIGDSEAGSIGKATRICLTKKGIYEDIYKKALFLTIDSKGLVEALRKKDVDAVLNWRAVKYVHENDRYIEELRLPEEQALRQKLTMGLLNCSQNPALGQLFLELAVSSRGREIFSRYGLYR